MLFLTKLQLKALSQVFFQPEEEVQVHSYLWGNMSSACAGMRFIYDER